MSDLTPETLVDTINELTDRLAHMTEARDNARAEVERLAGLWGSVREQVANGALCPMCCTGMTRRTVGMACQLCGTDYSSPEYASLRRDSEQTSKHARKAHR